MNSLNIQHIWRFEFLYLTPQDRANSTTKCFIDFSHLCASLHEEINKIRI